MQPIIIIHSGLGSRPKTDTHKQQVESALRRIVEESYAFLQHHSAVEAVVHAVSLLEDDPLFNAGTGSKIQSDGVIRMTASVMDGEQQRFAGVINIREVQNPVKIAAILLPQDDRVLAGEEATAFARSQGFPKYNPETQARRDEYHAQHLGKSGTVGCVALDSEGRLAAATSTGGKGFEMPGRVSDSATVAGNYANGFAAISCTGTGEDIVNAALAARIVTRVTDGMPLCDACSLSIAELKERNGEAAVIGIDRHGAVYQAATEPYLSYAIHDGTVVVGS